MAAVCCEMNAVPVAASCSVAIQASLALCFSLVQKRKKDELSHFLLELQQLNISTESRVNAFPSFIIWCQIFENVSCPKILG